VPLDEETFKKSFHNSHSDWLDIARAQPGTYPISADLLKELEILFDKATTYFIYVYGSNDYASARYKHAQLWEEIRKMAKEILNKKSI